MRDNPLMGSIKITTSLSIPPQAYPAGNPELSLLQSYAICSDGQLSAIQQGGVDSPWQ